MARSDYRGLLSAVTTEAAGSDLESGAEQVLPASSAWRVGGKAVGAVLACCGLAVGTYVALRSTASSPTDFKSVAVVGLNSAIDPEVRSKLDDFNSKVHSHEQELMRNYGLPSDLDDPKVLDFIKDLSAHAPQQKGGNMAMNDALAFMHEAGVVVNPGADPAQHRALEEFNAAAKKHDQETIRQFGDKMPFQKVQELVREVLDEDATKDDPLAESLRADPEVEKILHAASRDSKKNIHMLNDVIATAQKEYEASATVPPPATPATAAPAASVPPPAA